MRSCCGLQKALRGGLVEIALDLDAGAPTKAAGTGDDIEVLIASFEGGGRFCDAVALATEGNTRTRWEAGQARTLPESLNGLGNHLVLLVTIEGAVMGASVGRRHFAGQIYGSNMRVC